MKKIPLPASSISCDLSNIETPRTILTFFKKIKLIGYISLITVVVLTLLVLAVGHFSRYPNQYVQVEKGQPSATLDKNGMGVMHINEKPTSFWRTSDTFRVPVGRVSFNLFYSDRRENVSYKRTEISTLEGQNYYVMRELNHDSPQPLSAIAHPVTTNSWIIHDLRDTVVIYQKVSDDHDVSITTTPREDYVFGEKLKKDALDIYLKHNP